MKLNVFEHFQNGGKIRKSNWPSNDYIYYDYLDDPFDKTIFTLRNADSSLTMVDAALFLYDDWEIYEEPKKLETFNFMKAMELSQGCHSVTQVGWKSKVLQHKPAHCSEIKLDLTLEDVFATDWYEVEQNAK